MKKQKELAIMPQMAKHKRYSVVFALVLLIACIFSGLNPQLVQAATTYYVSPQGSDNNNGSQATPFLTLQKAVDSVAEGDKVIVKNGTYVGAQLKKGGSATAWVTIQSETKGGAKIVSPQQLGHHGFYFYPTANYINVLDFDISGGQAAFLVDEGGHDLSFKGNTLHDIGRFCTDNTIGLVGLYLESATNIIVEGNTFQNVGRFSPGENGCQPTNKYYENHDHGIYINGSTAVLIKNNVFIDFNHGWPVQLYSGSGNTSRNIKILNNTFAFDNPYKTGQIILAGKIDALQIKNNIFYQPRTSALDFFEPSITNATVSNNIVSGVSLASFNASGVTYTNNKENQNPLLMNPTSFDFRLQATSPALNAGQALSEVPVDFNGTARPQGSGYDLGAFELVTTATSPSPSPTATATPVVTPTPTVMPTTSPVASPMTCAEDINLDRVVNLLDFSILSKNFFKTTLTTPRADINKDGAVNVIDFSLLSAKFLREC